MVYRSLRVLCFGILIFFFFQAEDGIRDIGVTGVQTCALPISQLPGVVASADVRLGAGSHASVAVGVAKLGLAGHSIVVGPGSAVIAGAAVSVTFKVWPAVLVVLLSSFTVPVRDTDDVHAKLSG